MQQEVLPSTGRSRVDILIAAKPGKAIWKGDDDGWHPFACSGDFLLRLAGCQGKDPIAEGQRAALATSWFCGRSAGAPA
jgi:hypothetical protein